MNDGVRLWVLCEDQGHELFLRRLCARVGVDRRRLHVLIRPDGHGSKEQWVRLQFRAFRQLRRAKRHQTRLYFLVVTDGDQLGWRSRKMTLFDQGNDDRTGDERLAIWVPTWNIETWLLWLLGRDDVTESKNLKHDPQLTRAAQDVYAQAAERWPRPRQHESERLPSLVDARSEAARHVPFLLA